MAQPNSANPFGPRLLPDSFPNFPDGQSGSGPDKLALAVLLGVCGSGLVYLLYKRRDRVTTTNISIPPPSQRPARQPNRVVEAEFSCIRDLPSEIRTRIWNALSYDDVLNLRLASQFTKYDIDTFVGLHGRIVSSGDPVKYDFFQKVALQSCKITELQAPIDHDFLLNPTVLQTLEIREHCIIPLENIKAILSVSFNLKSLKIRLNLNDSTEEISKVILESLPSMRNLTALHVKTKPRYSTDMKNASAEPLMSAAPKHIKRIHLEMPDLPEEELTKWKCLLDKQIQLENLTCNLGNVNWRYYEQVLRRNPTSLETLVLEGLRGWDTSLNIDDPFDWSIFSEFTSLKSIDFSCNLGGDHDVMNSINFENLPCVTIEEFFISRISLQPEAVDRVYNDMINLHRGALDHIGNPGIERANEMAWLIQQADEHLEDSWWNSERIWDVAFHGIFGISVSVFIVALLSRMNERRIGSSIHPHVDSNLTLTPTDYVIQPILFDD